MKRYKMLYEKSIDTIRRGGVKLFAKKAINYIKLQKYAKAGPVDPHSTFMDVLFINGCYLPHPSRYRVDHQKEQLYANGVCSNIVFYDKIDLDLIPNYRVFIFFRCPITPDIETFVKKAKEQNKLVLFDIDDLVIDKKYTDTIEYLKTMSAAEKQAYDDGVERTQKLLRLCDGAITSTERLATELKNYVPEVFVNRNTASDEMLALSNAVWKNREALLPQENMQVIKIGYFSGSITHNDDFQMILPVVKRIMEEHENIELHVVGELDIPAELTALRGRIKTAPFVDWKKLPGLIGNVDINIVPLTDTIFNEAKSENKWVEAALVKVPTVASKVGAFEKMVVHGKTGLLCANNEEWYNSLVKLIDDKSMRKLLAENAYNYCSKKCTTLYTGLPLKKYLFSKMKPNIVFVLPSTQISGGVLVVLKHCVMLRNKGFDVLILNENVEHKNIVKDGLELLVISKLNTGVYAHIDKCVASLWATLDFLKFYANIGQRYYLVQNFETNFYEPGNIFRFMANSTYISDYMPINYITISKWCMEWLLEDYDQSAKYAPNGIDTKLFYATERSFDGKIRILVEGNSDDYYKNVDESFKIIEGLDKDKYEIWFMSYQGKPKDWYRVDKFLHRIPNEKVGDIYRQCHILIKSSILESFSYPPLEMMATGGFVVVRENDGNREYIKNEVNCLTYNPDNLDTAIKAVDRICCDSELRKKLYDNGVETATYRRWETIEDSIFKLYD